MPQRALVVIDLQNAILDIPKMRRRRETQAALDDLVGRIAILIGRARHHKIPVIFVQHDGPSDHRLERGLPGWQIRQEILPVQGDRLFIRPRATHSSKPPWEAELGSRRVERLIAVGCMIEYCIDTTVRRAISLGYDVTLVADGHLTVDSGVLTFDQIISHHNSLLDGFDAGNHSVRVVPLSQVLLD